MSEGSGWASPAPAGLIALSMATIIFYASFAGHISAPGCLPIMGFWLIGGFAVQICVALIELKSGGFNGGNVFLFFSAFFMLSTGMEMVFKYIAIVYQWAPAYDGRVDGWAWLALGIALIPIAISYLHTTPLSMNLMVLCLCFTVIFIVGMDIGWMSHDAGAGPASWGALGATIFALYTVAGQFLNKNFGKTILPLGPPLIK